MKMIIGICIFYIMVCVLCIIGELLSWTNVSIGHICFCISNIALCIVLIILSWRGK